MGTEKSGEFDVIVVGATPAAAAAAIRARQLGRTVLLIHDGKPVESQPELTWLNASAAEALRVCALKPTAFEGTAFTGVQLFSGDLKRAVQCKDKELRGWIAPTSLVKQTLVAAARAAGCGIRALRIEKAAAADSQVELMCDGKAIRAQIVLVDDGVDSFAAGLFRLTPAARISSVCPFVWETHSTDAPAGIQLVLGPGRNLGIVLSSGDKLLTGLLIREAGAGGAATSYVEFSRGLHRAGMVAKHAVNPKAVLLPLGAALDMDSHVGKRSLMMGSAGGFAAAFSGDGLYPGLRSGLIAAECASRTIDAAMPQDELSKYESLWRSELADYLRMPNTDLSLLMPLVFNDSLQMSKRVARAFLLGEKF